MEDIKIIEKLNFTVDEENKETRLDKYLANQIEDTTRTYIEKLIKESFVSLNSKIINKSGKKLKLNDIVEVSIPFEKEIDLIAEDIPLDIVFENKDMIVINKKHNIVVHPAHGNYSGTLVNALLYYKKQLSDVNGLMRPGIIHRLDKDTSGLIIIAKNNVAHFKLSSMFSDKQITKTYICIVKGRFSENNLMGRIENYIGRDPKDRKKMTVVDKNGKIAISNYKVIDMVDDYSLVLVRIETGRTHQIRVHLKSINHPILGDGVYGSESKIAKRQMLHAFNLKFKSPIDNVEYNFYGELPEDFKALYKNIGFDKELKLKELVEHFNTR